MAEPTIDLTDAEKHGPIALIQAGRPLPDKYRFLRFEDKRHVELVWKGKARDVCTTVLPFETLAYVDERRAEATAARRVAERCGFMLDGMLRHERRARRELAQHLPVRAPAGGVTHNRRPTRPAPAP